MSTQDPTRSFLQSINPDAFSAKDPEEPSNTDPTPTPDPQEPDPVVEPQNDEGQDPTPEPEFVSYFSSDEDEPTNQEPTPEPQAPAKIKDKVKYNLKDYVDAYKDNLSEYFRYKNLDVDSLQAVDLLRIKMQKDNPSLDDSDIQLLLEDQYGIGLSKKSAPEDALPDEIDAINLENERIEKLMRLGSAKLKGAVAQARQELKAHVEGLSLPEVELDVELDADPTTIIEQYKESQIKEATELKEKVWVPSIKEAITKVGGFRQSFEIEANKGDKVVTELTYKLTDKQKQELETYLADYTPHPSDNKYVVNQETGEIDFTRFVSDKAKQLFADDMLRAQSKELIAQFKAKFFKEDVVNFQDEPKRGSAPQEQTDRQKTISEIFAKGSAHLKRN